MPVAVWISMCKESFSLLSMSPFCKFYNTVQIQGALLMGDDGRTQFWIVSASVKKKLTSVSNQGRIKLSIP